MTDFEIRNSSGEAPRGFGHGNPSPHGRSFESESQTAQKRGLSVGFSRAKSSLRLKYEAETQVIQKKLGSLESMRSQLGLSQRKMSQLLLVDPSAWTRWTKGGTSAKDQAPPHIYRMLQWYLALEEKYPALDVNFWLNTVWQVSTNSQQTDLRKELAESVRLSATLRSRIEQLELAVAGREQRADRLGLSRASDQTFTPDAALKPSSMRRVLVFALLAVLAVAIGFWLGRSSML